MLMTHAALVLAASHCLSPPMVPVVVGIVEWENHARNTQAVSPRNANGTYDYGLGQINSSNIPMLSKLFGRTITTKDLLDDDVCLNLKATQAILLRRYNGDPPPEIAAAYAAGASASIARNALGPPIETPAKPPPCAPAWDAWALASCGRTHPGTPRPPATIQEAHNAN